MLSRVAVTALSRMFSREEKSFQSSTSRAIPCTNHSPTSNSNQATQPDGTRLLNSL